MASQLITAQLLLGLTASFLLQQVVTTGRTGRVLDIAPTPEEMVRIPSGDFIMGATQRDISYAQWLCKTDSARLCNQANFRAETPPHRVRLSSFSISRTEVSNRQFEACVRAGACSPRTGHRPEPRLDASELPVIDVSWRDARAYCRWRGGDLPTEAQWERAARGSTSRRFPWGNLWNNHLCNHGRAESPRHDESDGFRYAAPVTAYPASRSPQGLLNVAGNVWEWVLDWYAADTYEQRGAVVANPTGPEQGSLRVIRGGSWAVPAFAVRTTTRGSAPESARSVDIGFRCAWNSD